MSKITFTSELPPRQPRHLHFPWLWLGQTQRRHSGLPPAECASTEIPRHLGGTGKLSVTAEQQRWKMKDTSHNSPDTGRGECSDGFQTRKRSCGGLGICTCKFFHKALKQATGLRQSKGWGGQTCSVKGHSGKTAGFLGQIRSVSQTCVFVCFTTL